MATPSEIINISPATTYCSELEYLITLQSEELTESQPRRSQRLREKNSFKDALEYAAVATAADRASSPQLFADIDEECSQLAQIPPNHAVVPNTYNNRTLNCGLKKRRINRLRSTSGKRRGCTKKQADADQTVTTTSSMPGKSKCKVGIKRGRSKRQVRPVQELLVEPMPSDKQQAIPTSNVSMDKCEFHSAGTNNPVPTIVPPKVSPVIINSTQSHSYQCMNLTQTVLPERYPAHFIHQLPSDPKYLTGTILSGELQRASSSVIINESNKMSDMTSTDSEKLSPSPPNVESWGSTTPSLSESLTEVFGTKRIRDALNIALPRQYRVQESQLPDIAFMLGVKVERLRNVLELTERLTLNELQQSRYESPELSSDEEVELVEKPYPYNKITTKSCKIVG